MPGGIRISIGFQSARPLNTISPTDRPQVLR